MQQKTGIPQKFLMIKIVPGNRGMTNPFFSTMAHTSPSACVSTGQHTHLSPWLTMVTKKSSPYLLIAVFFSHISARLHSQPWTIWSSCFLLVCCLEPCTLHQQLPSQRGTPENKWPKYIDSLFRKILTSIPFVEKSGFPWISSSSSHPSHSH